MLAKSAEARPSAAEVALRLEEMQNAPAAGAKHPARNKRLAVGVGAAVVLVSSLGLRFATTRRVQDSAFAAIRNPVPLTSNPGWEIWPDLAPDGNSVAYAWGERYERATQILIKKQGQDTPIKLVQAGPGEVVSAPRWSPRGRRILYKSTMDKGAGSAIWSVAADGSDRQKITDLQGHKMAEIDSSGFLNTLDWSPDEKQILFADKAGDNPRFSIYKLDLATKEPRKVTDPPSGFIGDLDPQFSPDGHSIAFRRTAGSWLAVVYLVPASGGEARPLLRQAQATWGYRWLSGRDLILSRLDGGSFKLYRLLIDDPAKVERLSGGEEGDMVMPAVSSGGRRIAWANLREDMNIYEVPVSGGPQTAVAHSVARDCCASAEPGGRLVFVSRRSGNFEQWITGPDGLNPVRVTDPKSATIGPPNWSPNGRQFIFHAVVDGTRAILSVTCERGGTRRGQPVRIGPRTMHMDWPAWSPDGKFIYFGHRPQGGESEIWRFPAAGEGEPSQVTRNGGRGGLLSSDGKWLYYEKNEAGAVIWRLPLSGIPQGSAPREERVIGPLATHVWTITGNEVIFYDPGSQTGSPLLRAFHAGIKRFRLIARVGKGVYALSASPDGRTVFFSQADRAGANIKVAEWGR